MALYWPGSGYYAGGRPAGPARDYFTSPLAHPAFGALLALQLEEMWRLLGHPDTFVVIEPGAGSGHLARDIVAYAEHLDASFRQALRYIGVERFSEVAMGTQRLPLQTLLADGLPFRDVTGCILSNELLDALPVHRVTVRQGRLKEIYVTKVGERFVEAEDEPSTPAIGDRLNQEQVRLEEGQKAEVCLELEPWMQQVADALERGFVLTIDYGYKAPDLYGRQRAKGTLRCYYRHTLAADPYVRLGEQDMTCHVDFTAVASLGAEYGLTNQPLQNQVSFLNNLGLRHYLQRLALSGLGQRERDANRMGILELARPGGLGEFKVLVQSKNVDGPAITGIQGASTQWIERLASLPLPLLDTDHLSLMEASYPHTAQGWEEGWPRM